MNKLFNELYFNQNSDPINQQKFGISLIMKN
jgi:hypothetical protein